MLWIQDSFNENTSCETISWANHFNLLSNWTIKETFGKKCATSERFLIHCATFFWVNLTLIIYDFQVFLPAWSWQVSGGEFFGCFELLKKPYYEVVSYHENWRSFVLMEERWDGVPLIGKSWSFPTLHIGAFWQNLAPCELSCHFYAAI